MSPAANEPSQPARPGTWLLATVQLADGRTMELRIPNAVSGSVSSYVPDDGEAPSIVMVDAGGQRRRGRLTQILGQ